MKRLLFTCLVAASAAFAAASESEHNHPPPEKLGTVHFVTACDSAVAAPFDHALALLHSFAYDSAEKEFIAITTRAPDCAMGHWGAAMALYHQLWSPPSATELASAREQLQAAAAHPAPTERERAWIAAASVYFSDTDPAHHAARAQQYARAMQSLSERYPSDDEAQIFYALALIATAPPTDRTHANQKQAVAILEPIYRRQPDHPGVAHYLIHACDSSELAARGLPAARAYAQIAPSAPHALHMPSHVFTRLGLWDDSIASNEAARHAAHVQGDIGEELHAMDYLTYAYLQRGRIADAERVVADLKAMGPLLAKDFKVGYAATAMPVRLAVEQQRWNDAAAIEPLAGSAPHVAALVYWAHALAHAQSGQADRVSADVSELERCAREARDHGDSYWAGQIDILALESQAWGAKAAGKTDDALALLRRAADAEDAVEKLPVTPGPIVPAREQLGQLLLSLQRPADAERELAQALKDAPGRRAGLEAAARAADAAGDAAAAAGYRRLLPS